MSDQLNDKELFESAISDTPSEKVAEAPVEQPVEQASDEGRVRDEKGRFAPKEAKPETVVEQQPEPAQAQAPVADKEAHVPSWRLREVNEAREAAERRAAQFESEMAQLRRLLQEQQKPKEEPVDFFQDPQAALKQHISPIESQFQTLAQNLTLRASKAEAIAVHGREKVAEMEAAIGKAMQERHPDIGILRTQMQNSDDPVGVAMQWHQRESLIRETGGDIAAFKSKMSEELLKDPAFLAKAIEAVKGQAAVPQGKATNTVQLPPSLNRAGSAASPHDDPGDLSDRSLYAQAIR